MSFKSLKVAKNIKETRRNKPIRKKPSCVFCLRGLPNTFSKKYIRPRKKSASYMIIDENDILYKVNNLWFIGDFNRAEDWAKVNVNGKYNVKGYGFRFPFLDIYPIIYNIQ